MKRQFHSFFAGMITTVLIAALALSVMAITGKTTIDVYPIDIMVNGEVFQPTNAQGKPVDVFTYKGTTYAPLRALAKAYGLEVGYDAEKKLATVSEPQPTPTPDTTAKTDYSDWSAEDEAAYQEFKSFWRIETEDSKNGKFVNLHGYEVGNPNLEKELDEFLSQRTVDKIEEFCLRFDEELYSKYGIPKIMYHFMARRGWGWSDTYSDGFSCGYRDYLDRLTW